VREKRRVVVAIMLYDVKLRAPGFSLQQNDNLADIRRAASCCGNCES